MLLMWDRNVKCLSTVTPRSFLHDDCSIFVVLRKNFLNSMCFSVWCRYAYRRCLCCIYLFSLHCLDTISVHKEYQDKGILVVLAWVVQLNVDCLGTFSGFLLMSLRICTTALRVTFATGRRASVHVRRKVLFRFRTFNPVMWCCNMCRWAWLFECVQKGGRDMAWSMLSTMMDKCLPVSGCIPCCSSVSMGRYLVHSHQPGNVSGGGVCGTS